MVTHCTFSENFTLGQFSHGGAIAANQGLLTLEHSTVNSNRIFNMPMPRTGGLVVNNGTVLMHHVVFGGNPAPALECTFNSTLISQGYNLISDHMGCGGSLAVGDVVGLDPLLGPLRFNGGLTPTHALSAGSPAIDTGDPGFVPQPGVTDRDQPGRPRC